MLNLGTCQDDQIASGDVSNSGTDKFDMYTEAVMSDPGGFKVLIGTTHWLASPLQ